LLVTLAVAVSLAACGGEEATPPPKAPEAPVATAAPPPVAPEAPKEEAKPQPSLAELQRKTSEGLGTALNAHDAKKLASFYTENAKLKMAGMPDLDGRDAVAKHWEGVFKAFPTMKTAASRVWVKGDVVVVEWGWTGTHGAEFPPGVKATEKPVGAMGVDVMWFSPDGLVKEQHTYTDMTTVMGQIGASKQKARPVPTLATGAPQVIPATGSADETKNVETVAKTWAAFEKKSDADFLAASADDVVWEDMTQPEPMKGKAAAKKFFQEMTKAFPDAKSTPTNAWGIGDYVIAEGTFTGTQKGPLFGMPPKNKAVSLHMLDIVQLKDGKVVKGWTYGNDMEMAMQLGLLPPPAAKPAAAPPKK